MLVPAVLAASIVASTALAAPAESGVEKRAGTQLCGQWDTELEGNYYLENNLWGESGYTGSQCSQQTSLSGSTVAWYTDYTWSGGPYQVKSYANLDLQVGLKKQISTITSIPSTWKWTYTSASSDLVADVSYDLWLSTSSSGTGASSTSSYEIMIWLSSRGGAGPAGSQVGTASVNGLTWTLYQGVVSTWTVYSFVAPSELTSFSEDLLPFITYLCSHYGISTSQYLVQLQAGTEPFIGTARLTTTAYSTTVNSGGSTGTTTSKTTTTTTKTSTTTSKTSTGGSTGSGTVAHYGQCGGAGYTGSTTCASPYTCVYSNDWYSQCL